MVSASFSGGGFSQPEVGFIEHVSNIAKYTAGFPIATFMMSTYDGTLVAIFIATVLVPIGGLINREA